MKIVIDITEETADATLQAVAASQGWSQLSAAEIIDKLAVLLAEQVQGMAFIGQALLVKKADDEQRKEALKLAVVGAKG